MQSSPQTRCDTDLADAVGEVIATRLRRMQSRLPRQVDLQPGKMLRTRLAARLVAHGGSGAPLEVIAAGCAAIELVHTASLCHDDLIDESPLRRHRPAVWTVLGRPAAILTGDLLLCDAMELVVESMGGAHVQSFLAKVRTVVEAEIRQELIQRGRTLEAEDCMQVAREKTGPLFAFVAEICGGSDRRLTRALEEAGYLVGTAYQLADDLLDVCGQSEEAGKSLGTDLKRSKFTLAQGPSDAPAATARMVRRLLSDAVDALDEWPPAREGLAAFIEQDLLGSPVARGVRLEEEAHR